MEPILFWWSVWTASGYPELMSEGGNVIVPECGDAMSQHGVPRRSRLSMLMGFVRLFQSLPWVLVSRQVILLTVVLLGSTMSMRGGVVQFGGSLVVFVVGSVVISSGHKF
jgi:hypothetical protein